MFRLILALCFVSLLFIAGCGSKEHSTTARIAVAANFSTTAEALKTAFEKQNKGEIEIILGSTGKLYSQIDNGAPFDAFLSADTERPALIKNKKDEPFIYAIGQLVICSADPNLVYNDDFDHTDFQSVAIANPEIAPYGTAAKQFLESEGIYDELEDKIIIGQNISQTFQFVASGNVHIGYVALSQVINSEDLVDYKFTDAPGIEQGAILLTDNQIAKQFIEFLKNNNEAHQILRDNGYIVPEKGDEFD